MMKLAKVNVTVSRLIYRVVARAALSFLQLLQMRISFCYKREVFFLVSTQFKMFLWKMLKFSMLILVGAHN